MTSNTKNTKTAIFFIAGDVFPFSQYRMKPYSKKKLTREFFLITVSLENNVSLKLYLEYEVIDSEYVQAGSN